MFILRVVLVICAVLIALSGARPSTNEVEIMDLSEKAKIKLFQKHLQQASKFRCRQPQQRAVDGESLLEKGMLQSSEFLQPTSTFLYKCDAEAGCCQRSDEECGPWRQERVVLWFKMEDKVTHNCRYVPVVAYNHTECGCQNKWLHSASVTSSSATDTVYIGGSRPLLPLANLIHIFIVRLIFKLLF